jgi:predicted amidohydrolase YtcJ
MEYTEKISGNGIVELKTYGAHEHFIDRYAHRIPGVLTDISLHSAVLSPEVWQENSAIIGEAKELFSAHAERSKFYNPHTRRIAGPIWQSLMVRMLEKMYGSSRDVMINAWLDGLYKNGWSTVRDPWMPHPVVKHVSEDYDSYKDRLSGVAVTPVDEKNLEEIVDPLLELRENGAETSVKLFADGSLGAGSVNIPYESTRTLNNARMLIEKADLRGVLIHTIGDDALISGLIWWHNLKEETVRPDLELGLQHIEIVTQKAFKALYKLRTEPNVRFCMQPNFWPYDFMAYAGDLPSKRHSEFLPLGLMYKTFGDRLDLGTDGSPSSIVYLAAASLLHPHKNGRLQDLDEFFKIVGKGKGKPIRFDTDSFARLMNDPELRKRFLYSVHSGQEGRKTLKMVHDSVLSTY